jgi:hypothetical protein
VETTECAHCGAALPPGAGFCRACDTPVEGAQSGRLSVAESVPVPARHRWLVILGVLAVVALLGGATYGAVHMVKSRAAGAADQATRNARVGLTGLVRAEGGQVRECKMSAHYLAGSRRAETQACLAVVGSDPGAHLENVHLGTPQLTSQTGTVRVTATFVDDTGSHAFDRTVHLVDQGGQWLVSWDGHRTT